MERSKLPVLTRRSRTALYLVVCLAFLWIPDHSRAAVVRVSTTCPIVAFGDSITWGAYASVQGEFYRDLLPLKEHQVGPEDTSYPGDLARLVHQTVCNYGFPGEMAMQGVSRLALLSHHARPHWLLIMEGVNDFAARRTVPEVLQSLKAMVRLGQQAHSKVVLLTLTPTYYPPDDPHQFINGDVEIASIDIRRMGKHLNVPIADVNAAFVQDGRGVSLTVHDGVPDYLHPNDAGYRIIAHTVARILR